MEEKHLIADIPLKSILKKWISAQDLEDAPMKEWYKKVLTKYFKS